VAGQTSRIWTWGGTAGCQLAHNKGRATSTLCYGRSVTRPLNDWVQTTHLHCLTLATLIEPCRTRPSHLCSAYNLQRHVCYSKTHSVPSTTCRSPIYHHRLCRCLYRIRTAVLSLASTQSPHNSCHPSLIPTLLKQNDPGRFYHTSPCLLRHNAPIPPFLVEKGTPWSRAYLIHFVVCLAKLINTHCGDYRYILDAHCPRGTCKKAIVSRLGVRVTIVRLDSGVCVLMQRIIVGYVEGVRGCVWWTTRKRS
jgi:hypothetical protein